MIFLNNFNRGYRLNTNYKLFDFVFTVYHELRHAICAQKLSVMDDKYYYDMNKFSIVVDSCRIIDRDDYRKHHDEYMIEIDADKYALRKLGNYFKDDKDFYYKNKNYYDLNYFYNSYRDINYDIQLSIDILNTLLKDKKNMFLLDEYFILKLFYCESDGNIYYKKLSELMNDPTVNSFDYGIRANMIASKDFLENIDFSLLSSSELDYLLRCINYVYDNYLVRKRASSKFLRTKVENLDSDYYVGEWDHIYNKRIMNSKKMINTMNI